jgi:hypothetical protein
MRPRVCPCSSTLCCNLNDALGRTGFVLVVFVISTRDGSTMRVSIVKLAAMRPIGTVTFVGSIVGFCYMFFVRLD